MKTSNIRPMLLALLLTLTINPVCGFAQQQPQPQNDEQTIANLQARVASLEQRIPHHAYDGAIVWLFGAFCALWAQNTGRNAWLWFFVGMLFSVIAVLVLLYKNSEDKKRRT